MQNKIPTEHERSFKSHLFDFEALLLALGAARGRHLNLLLVHVHARWSHCFCGVEITCSTANVQNNVREISSKSTNSECSPAECPTASGLGSWSKLAHSRRNVRFPVDKKFGFLLKLVRPAEFVVKAKQEGGGRRDRPRCTKEVRLVENVHPPHYFIILAKANSACGDANKQ